MANTNLLLIGGIALLAGAFLFKDQIMGALSGAGGGGMGGSDITQQIAQYIGGLSPTMKECIKQRCQDCLEPGGLYCGDCAMQRCGLANPFGPKSAFSRITVV